MCNQFYLRYSFPCRATVPLLLAGLISEFSANGNGNSYPAQIYAALLIACILASVLLTHPYMMGMMVSNSSTGTDFT